MISAIALLFAAYLAPLVLYAVYKIRRSNRSIAQAENSSLPFQPELGPKPALLHRFASPERVYLIQQLKLAAGFYLLMSWTEFFILTLPIFKPVSSATKWFDVSAYTWFIFLRNAASSQKFLSTMLFFCAFLMVIPLRVGAQALFHRTRPISVSFLFWARVLPFTAALTTAMLTGIGLALLLLLGTKGHIWQNLPAAIPRVLGPDDADVAQAYLNLLRTSPPRIFLSMVTTVPLVFSSFVAIFSIPVNRWSSRGTLPTYLASILFIGFLGSFFLASFALSSSADTFHAPRLLFLYGSLGPPPEYAFIAGPVLFSALLLLLARVFVNRIEI